DAPERLAALAEDPARAAEYRAAHVAQWRRRVLCAFNRGGDCTIYPARPLVCRNAHAVETSERCFGDHPGGRPAVRLGFAPLDEFLARTRQLLRAAHHAVADSPRDHGALCAVVHHLLGAP